MAGKGSSPLVDVSRRLAQRVDALSFGPPVTHVYDPLVYARELHERYLDRYGRGTRDVLFLGMNPGPFGMAQCGVPFGEVGLVRDWLGIRGSVDQPPSPHPKRPVEGLDHPRSEVSGRRLWGWARDRFGTPEAFFDRFFVANYCPLLFLEESGRNRTPDKLPANERAPLFAACDDALRETIGILRPRRVVGVGAFAARRAREVVGDGGPEVGSVLHPSPASPRANRGWAAAAEAELRAQGIPL